MAATRRDFIGLGAGLVCGSLVEQTGAAAPPDRHRCLDYGRSFLCHKGESAASNGVRFQVESRTTLIDEKNELTHVFYQCASCKSEDTFAKKDLFQKDNYHAWITASNAFNHPPLKHLADHPIWSKNPKLAMLPKEAEYAHERGWPAKPSAAV